MEISLSFFFFFFFFFFNVNKNRCISGVCGSDLDLIISKVFVTCATQLMSQGKKSYKIIHYTVWNI